MTPTLVYWDSATFLAYFQQEEGRFERAERGQVGIVTSSLALAECLWLRGQTVPIPKDRADVIRKFFRRSFIRVRNVTRKTSELAQDVVWDYGVRPKDAIHVATALECHLSVIETFDEPFIGKSGQIGSPGIKIRKPLSATQGKLL